MPGLRSRRCARSIAFKIGHAAFEAGIVGAEWPARMQRLSSGELLELAPQGCEIWLDGGHNAEGGRVAAAALGDLEERVSRPLVVIVGMMANKDARGVSRQFRRPDPPHHRGADSRTRTTRCRRTGWPTPRARSACASRSPAASRPRCARIARLAYEVPPRILITGSLYLAGHVLAAQRHAAGIGLTMRFAAIADVHGNHLALEAVIADIRAQGITDIVNLGDMVSGPLDARRDHGHADGDRCRSRARQPRPLSDRPAAGEDGIVGPAGLCAARSGASRLAAHRAADACLSRSGLSLSCHARERRGTTGSTQCFPTARLRCRRCERSRSLRQASTQSLILCAHTHLSRARCGSPMAG